MELTVEQRAVVDHPGPLAVVTGGPGCGRTTVLVERYRRLACRHAASRLLVLCHDRGAAQRFLAAVLPGLRGGFDGLPVTTVHGVAYDVVARERGSVELVGGAARRARLRRLLAATPAADWADVAGLASRAGFVDEVDAGLDRVWDVGIDAAEAAGGRWAALARFARRYESSLAEDGTVDGRTLLAEAASILVSRRDRFDHVLVDDADRLDGDGRRLVRALVAGGAAATVVDVDDVAWDGATELRLARSFRVAPPGRLVRCTHPSVEAEAVAGELLRAHADGVPWSAMAVLTRHGRGRRARSIGRALARHGVPAIVPAGSPVDEPVVAAVVDLLWWVDGDDAALDRLLASPLAGLDPRAVRDVRRAAAEGVPLEADPRLARLVALRDRLQARWEAGDRAADLAYEAWAGGLAHLGQAELGAVDDRALDALVALVDGLARHDGHGTGAEPARPPLADTLAALAEGALPPDGWRTAASAGAHGVTVTSITAAAGREWHTVVVAGCVEGELPRARARAPLFDPAHLGRMADGLAEERRLFGVATSRATAQLIATAAPEPGVLLSRFVEAWPDEPVRLPLAPGRPPPQRAATAGVDRVFPAGSLVLSATQLDTYADCPLRYAYQYVLRARDEPGVHAALGSLVHEVLAEFLDPDHPDPPPEPSLEGLLAVADAHWHDDIARYRPQAEEARRDLVDMLTAWWEVEGAPEPAPDIVAVERRFDIEVGPHRLVGTIDRVDRVPLAGGGAGLRVVDYKTGKSEPPRGDVADDVQLAVYHLAATRDPALAAVGPPVELQLRYLRTMHDFRQPILDDHAERTERRVLDIASRILAEDFEPSVDANCRTCAFHRLCPLQPQGRQVGA